MSYRDTHPATQTFKEAIPVFFEGHSRLIVNIVDHKYNINGLFFSDAGWDNTGNSLDDSYVHVLYNQKEYTYYTSYTLINVHSCLELFFAKDLDEFYQKVSFLKKRNSLDEYYNILLELLDYLYNLDIIFYNSLVSKYASKLQSKDLVNNQMFHEDIAKYVIKRINNKIDYDTIRSGIDFIYKKYYDYNDDRKRKRAVNNTMLDNYENYDYFFPIYHLNPYEPEDFNKFKKPR